MVTVRLEYVMIPHCGSRLLLGVLSWGMFGQSSRDLGSASSQKSGKAPGEHFCVPDVALSAPFPSAVRNLCVQERILLGPSAASAAGHAADGAGARRAYS